MQVFVIEILNLIIFKSIKSKIVIINKSDLSIKLVDFGVSRRYVSYNPNTFKYNK